MNDVPVNVVLDSWAVLRFLENTEPAASLIEDLIETSIPLMSWINLGEVHYVLRRRHGEQAAADTVRDLRAVLDVRLPDEHMVLTAARLKADHPMAYADAFGAAFAIIESATLWTGVPELLTPASPWAWRDVR